MVTHDEVENFMPVFEESGVRNWELDFNLSSPASQFQIPNSLTLLSKIKDKWLLIFFRCWALTMLNFG
jgi:hypothetical protein